MKSTHLFFALLLSCSSPKSPPPKEQPASKPAATKPSPKTKAAPAEWTKASGIPAVDLLGVSFLNEKEASVVGDIGPGNGPILHTQNAGESWIVGTTTAEILTDVSFDGEKGAAVGYAGHIAVSNDAARSWKVVMRDEQTILRGVARRGDIIVAVGDQTLLVSTDAGASFTAMPLPSSIELQDVILWSDSESAAVSSEGHILLTKDLWKTHSEKILSRGPFFSVAHTSKNICAAGGNNITCVDEALQPTVLFVDETFELFDIAADGGRLLAVGAKGLILYSTDGVDWIKQTSNTTEDLFAVSIRNKHAIIVGAKGTILSKPLAP
jgi:hypothetical protein